MAVTRPEVPIVATPVLVLLHVPPKVASESVAVVPRHRLLGPEIAGTVLKVTVLVTVQTPPSE